MKKLVPVLAAICCLSACATNANMDLVDNMRTLEQTTHSEIDIAETLKLAQTAFNGEDYETSLGLYHRIILRQSDHIHAGLGYGNSALALNRPREAAKQFAHLKTLDLPGDISRSVEAGQVLAELMAGRYEEPLDHVNTAIEEFSTDARLWNAKGLIHDSRQEWLLALDAYVSAMKTGQAHSGIVNNMGMSLMKQGRFEEALLKFEQALEIKPASRLYDNNRRLALFLGNEIRLGLKDIPDARAASLLNDAGYIAMQQGRPALARLLIKHAIKVSPSYHVKAVENLKVLEARNRDSS